MVSAAWIEVFTLTVSRLVSSLGFLSACSLAGLSVHAAVRTDVRSSHVNEVTLHVIRRNNMTGR